MRYTKKAMSAFLAALVIMTVMTALLPAVYAEETIPVPVIDSVSVTGCDSLCISWTAVTGDALGYVLYRRTSGGDSYTEIARIPAFTETGFEYADKGLVCGTAYEYCLAVYRLIDSTLIVGDKSEPVSGTPLPAKVTLSSAVSTGYNSVCVTWEKVNGASGYVVYRSETNLDGSWKRLVTTRDSAVLSYTASGLSCGTKYYFIVKAYCTVGETLIYGSSSASRSAVPLPSAPTVSAKSASYKSAAVSWSKVDGASGYAVYRSATGKSGSWSRIYTASASVLTYTDSKVTCGTVYYYAVKAYRVVNEVNIYGALSAAVSLKVAPAAPTLSSATAISCHNATLTWKKVTGASGYAVYRSATGKDGSWTRVATIKSADTLSCTTSGLVGSTTYYFCVAAYRTVNGTNCYSKISKALTVKTYSAYTVLKNWMVKNGTKSDDGYSITSKVSGGGSTKTYIIMYTPDNNAICIAEAVSTSSASAFYGLGFDKVSTQYEFAYYNYINGAQGAGYLSAPQLGNDSYCVGFSEFDGSGDADSIAVTTTARLAEAMKWAQTNVFEKRNVGINLKDLRFDSLA